MLFPFWLDAYDLKHSDLEGQKLKMVGPQVGRNLAHSAENCQLIMNMCFGFHLTSKSISLCYTTKILGFVFYSS